MNANMNYLDGNAAAGELSRIFAIDLTSTEAQCANCSARKPFAEAHLYVDCPGLVARCPLCGHVLLRMATVHQHTFLDLRGVTYLMFDTAP